MNQQLALDNILTGLVDLSICHFHSFAATRSSLSRPVAALTVLEQAYLHSEYPARLPTVHKGVESIRPLQTSLLGVIEKVIAESATTDPCSVSGALPTENGELD